MAPSLTEMASITLPGSGAPASEPELSIEPRIINGEDAAPGSWPWHVMLQTSNGHLLCGGSLINENWVITSAYCKFTTSNQVVAGLFDKSSREDDFQILNISQIFRHHNFNLRTLYSDIALLKLATPALFHNNVSPVPLPSLSDEFPPDIMCTIIGWGKTRIHGSDLPSKLQQASVPLVSMAKCRKYWPNINTRTTICAGLNGVSSYHGDSGGSLVCKRNGIWTLVGILSYGSKTCRYCKPFVATRVNAFKPWVDEILARN
ncbi:chymotrypsinogen B-like [Talpa occidentalis]|uniref:chymotrypsinogen B-like n=1 Tax=Talpa occidentalis TaxID=50954 RepID=UPI00189016B9|nr:chymotrypsinogen B-like [Talpa occidentalis]